MALSPEDKYRFALRVIGFACTTFYVFIYGFYLSPKQCIRILLLPARDCHVLPLRHRRDGVLDAIAAPRR